MQLATIYRRQGKLLFLALSRTVAGFWVQTDPILSLAADADEGDVVAALTAALDGSKSGIDGPTDWKEYQKRFLKTMGAKSMKEVYSPGAVSCGAEREGDQIKFSSSRNAGPKEGFALLPSVPDIVADARNPHEVYARLMEMLSKCQ